MLLRGARGRKNSKKGLGSCIYAGWSTLWCAETYMLEAWLDLWEKQRRSCAKAMAPATQEGCQDTSHRCVPKAFSTDTQPQLKLLPSFQQYFSAVSWISQGSGHPHPKCLSCSVLEGEEQVLHYPSHCNKTFNVLVILPDSFHLCSTQQTYIHSAIVYLQCPRIQNGTLLTSGFTL